jgi:hypothetical protein
MQVNDTIITHATIILTRNHFIDNCNACITGATKGDFRVNDLSKYVAWQQRCISSMRNGESDHTLTFLQRALWLQTGNCVAILP